MSRFLSARAGRVLVALVVTAVGATLGARALYAWGDLGHRLTGQAAAGALPATMPAFFRNAAAQLAYLNPEPDRWRERGERTLDGALEGATAPDHFIDLEMIPDSMRAGTLAAADRYAYVDSLQKAGVEAATVGALPYRILEMTQRLRVGFRLWRAAPNPQTREWIEQRIINDAGILGHYVADGSNPAHTTIHYNGWAKGSPNPNGYATDSRFHSRFESAYVQARIRLADVQAGVVRAPRTFPELRPAIVRYVHETHAYVDTLYAIDKRAAFNAQTTAAENKRFAAARLAAGATMLRDLWWTAWITSAPTAADSARTRR
jgi:hypothetical protein